MTVAISHTRPAGVPQGPYLVLGCGEAGVSAARALADLVGPAAVRMWDVHDGPETRGATGALRADGVRVELGPWRDEQFDAPAPGAVVKSPGVAPTCAPVAEALRRGLPVLDELELGCRLTARPLIAVTGTDGKSTVCGLLATALGDARDPAPVTGNTEFGPPLTGLPATGGMAVVETSSYQLELCPGPFAEMAVMTGISAEHLGRHGTMRAYGEAKRRAFLVGDRAVPRAVVNVDGPFGRALVRDLRAAGAVAVGIAAGASADYRVAEATWDIGSARLRIASPGGEVLLHTRLPGAHNAANVAAALAACDLLDVPRDRALAALGSFPGVPGRWQRIDAGQPFDVVVDFAHTPNALRQMLLTARGAVAGRDGARVHLLLSSGGGHARDRRAPLGRLASELADRVVVTEGNGRGEPPAQVIAGILAGARGERATFEVEPDRRAGIRRLLAGAAAGDLAIVAGRGVMPRLVTNFAGGGPPFDDGTVTREELARLAAGAPAVTA